MKKVYLVFIFFILVSISYSFSLHPVLISLIGFGAGIQYMKIKNNLKD